MKDWTGFDPIKIERPDPKLFTYYLVCAILTGPLTPLFLLPFWLRYITLRYKFDVDGVSMSWGVFFRREVYLTYRRIQDIHLTRNLLQRWMGLATISLQTASGNAQAEMTIEGILEADELRDFLYSRMRGARDGQSISVVAQESAIKRQAVSSLGAQLDSPVAEDRYLQLLIEIRDALQTVANSRGRLS